LDRKDVDTDFVCQNDQEAFTKIGPKKPDSAETLDLCLNSLHGGLHEHTCDIMKLCGDVDVMRLAIASQAVDIQDVQRSAEDLRKTEEQRDMDAQVWSMMNSSIVSSAELREYVISEVQKQAAAFEESLGVLARFQKRLGEIEEHVGLYGNPQGEHMSIRTIMTSGEIGSAPTCPGTIMTSPTRLGNNNERSLPVLIVDHNETFEHVPLLAEDDAFEASDNECSQCAAWIESPKVRSRASEHHTPLPMPRALARLDVSTSPPRSPRSFLRREFNEGSDSVMGSPASITVDIDDPFNSEVEYGKYVNTISAALKNMDAKKDSL